LKDNENRNIPYNWFSTEANVETCYYFNWKKRKKRKRNV